MMSRVSGKIRFAARWFLIAAVLAGLFFSSGEGIQLLPFPAAPGTVEKNVFLLPDEPFKSYSLSVCNSAAHTAKVNAKTQKIPKFLGGPDFSGTNLQADGFTGSPVLRNNSAQIIFNTPGLKTSLSDRAPPAI